MLPYHKKCAPQISFGIFFFKQERQEFRAGKSRFIKIAVEDRAQSLCIYMHRLTKDFTE